jgi:hypothetical protein
MPYNVSICYHSCRHAIVYKPLVICVSIISRLCLSTFNFAKLRSSLLDTAARNSGLYPPLNAASQPS